MKYFSFLTIVLFLATSTVFAAPCFHQGSYKGMGFGTDESGKQYSYSVNTNITSANQASSDYTWSPNGKANISILAQGGLVYVNGSPKASGNASCEMAASRISLKHSDKERSIQVDEEWAFLGNYLLRRGSKVVGEKTIVYQELLIRQE